MRVILGAWGIGAFVAANSAVWRDRFGKNPHFKGTLPPMSSIFCGMVEPFPFVLATKIFVDADQYEFLISGGDGLTSRLHNSLPIILREFERQGILAPVSFRALLRSKMSSAVGIAEDVLSSDELPAAAAESRRLWANFLRSPGAEVLPNLLDELRISETRDHSESERRVLLSDLYPHVEIPLNRRTATRAAIECGHDVFDVVALLSLARDLDAVVGDWHMYDPLYSLAIRLGRFYFLTDGTPTDKDRNFRCYIPIPGVMDVDDIWRLREDPYVAALRDGNVARMIGAFSQFETPESWRELRKQIRERAGTVIFNPYNAHTREQGDSVLTEAVGVSLGGSTTMQLGSRAFASVFISYGGPDEAFAERLNVTLSNAGVKTFLFKQHAKPGQKLHSLMREGVNHYDRVVLVCSRNSLNRSGVINELEETLQREAREGGTSVLIPISLDQYVFSDWAPNRPDLARAVRDRVVADFHEASEGGRQFDAAVARLLEALRDVEGAQ